MERSTGIVITFQSGFFAEILDVTPPEISRDSIDFTNTDSSDLAKEFFPAKFVDYGELEVEMGFAPGTTPPIDAAAAPFVITFPDSGSSAWTGQGFLTNYAPAAPFEDRMTCTATLKVTGKITIA